MIYRDTATRPTGKHNNRLNCKLLFTGEGVINTTDKESPSRNSNNCSYKIMG